MKEGMKVKVIKKGENKAPVKVQAPKSKRAAARDTADRRWLVLAAPRGNSWQRTRRRHSEDVLSRTPGPYRADGSVEREL